tara:strand:+ start:16956 stop:18005 length:1050 start_codon:yes stop_codon:yes gene_type:complete
MITELVSELDHVPDKNIVLINAIGLHRPNTKSELLTMLGPELVSRFRIISPKPRTASCNVFVGHTSSGRPVALNREYVEADIRITTGFIEPHFFAGFSGGAKLTLPGVASAESILANHDANMIGDSNSTWGETEGNPVFEEQREAALLCAPDMILNVTLNSNKQITAVFAGSLKVAHNAGCHHSRSVSMQPITELFDVVITTNSGWPLDLNFYQSVKGISAGSRAVKPGGHIIIAAECREGLGHNNFEKMIGSGHNPAKLSKIIESRNTPEIDQWQAQVLALIQQKSRIHIMSDYLSEEQITQIGCTPCKNIENTVRKLREHDRTGKICVIPQGPQTIPFLASQPNFSC